MIYSQYKEHQIQLDFNQFVHSPMHVLPQYFHTLLLAVQHFVKLVSAGALFNLNNVTWAKKEEVQKNSPFNLHLHRRLKSLKCREIKWEDNLPWIIFKLLVRFTLIHFTTTSFSLNKLNSWKQESVKFTPW